MLTQQDNHLITRAGPGTAVGELFRRFWLPAMLPEELPSPDCPPLRITLLGERLVAFRATDGTVGFVAESCPHRGASMFFGRNEEQGLRCVYHGWKFDVSGACVDMPNEPAESNFKHKIRMTAYPSREWQGIVWIYMGPADLKPELPQFEWTAVPSANRYIGKYLVEANYLQVIEGSIDTVHSTYLHRGPSTLQHEAPRRVLLDFSRDVAPRFFTKETEYGVMVAARRDAPDDRYFWRITQVYLPSYSMIPADPDGGASLIMTVPSDDVTCYCWKWTWNPKQPWTEEQVADLKGGSKRRIGGISYPELLPGVLRPVANARNDYFIDRELQKTLNFTGIPGQSEQDLAVQESMGPVMDRTKEHLGNTDLGIIGARRRILRAARSLQQGIEPLAAADGSLYHVRSGAAVIPRDSAFETDPTLTAALVPRA
jgi:phthalate 4,5-dioxygenase